VQWKQGAITLKQLRNGTELARKEHTEIVTELTPIQDVGNSKSFALHFFLVKYHRKQLKFGVQIFMYLIYKHYFVKVKIIRQLT
jgi:hypothetical protein